MYIYCSRHILQRRTVRPVFVSIIAHGRPNIYILCVPTRADTGTQVCCVAHARIYRVTLAPLLFYPRRTLTLAPHYLFSHRTERSSACERAHELHNSSSHTHTHVYIMLRSITKGAQREREASLTNQHSALRHRRRRRRRRRHVAHTSGEKTI